MPILIDIEWLAALREHPRPDASESDNPCGPTLQPRRTFAKGRLRRLFRFFTIAMIAVAVASPAIAKELKLRIGVQKYGTLILLRLRGTLAERLAKEGVSVEWAEFPSGPPLLEALAAGSIDFGTTGEAPPVFAQAAGAPLLYVGVEPSAPSGEAILVPKDSPIHSLHDLAGKRIALNKGSNVHYLLVEALAKAGLKPSDAQPVYLAPADARAAFERGSVDAWVIWDPFLSAAQHATQARTLADGTGLASNDQFYLAHRDFLAAHPGIVRILLEEIVATDVWASTHQHEMAALFAARTGLSSEVLEVALSRLSYGVKPLDQETIENQQRIADVFHAIGLIPKPIIVRDTVWNPQS